MKKLKMFLLLISMLSAITFTACGGGGGGGSSSGGGSNSGDGSGGGDGGGGGGGGDVQIAPDMSGVPESMTFDERSAAMDQVNQYWSNINTGNIDSDNQALLDYILTLSEFADAGIAPDKTVWARFIDGFPAVFVTKIVPQGTVIPNAMPSITQTANVTPLAEIPQGDKAVLIDVDTLAAGSLATIEPALTNKGYATSKPNGTIADFELINNVSVLFISSHGGTGVTKAGRASYGIMTNERLLTYGDQYRGQLYYSGMIDIASVRVRDTNGAQISLPGKFWSITEEFVKNKWTFTQNSLVVVDSCDIFLDQRLDVVAHKAPYENFRAALKAKNAGAIVGWDGKISPGFASNVMQLFFDRVLGANAYQPENPKQRPFPYKDVHDWLVNTGKHRESGGGGLTLQYSMDAPGQLVPTIQYAVVSKVLPQGLAYSLWLVGEFGSDAGTVTVNGIALTLLEPWNNSILIAELPLSGPAPAPYGDIVVDVRNHKSNAVPFTKWIGTVSQSQAGKYGGGGKFDVSCPVQVSGDVHFARSQPAEVPHIVFSEVYLEVTGPCNYTHSGQWFVGDILWEASGSGTTSISSSIINVIQAVSSIQTLPAELQDLVGGYFDAAPGVHRWTTPDGYFEDIPVYGSWAATSGITLGSDYRLTKPQSCINFFSPQCTQTWNLQPVSGSIPTVDTES